MSHVLDHTVAATHAHPYALTHAHAVFIWRVYLMGSFITLDSKMWL